jgi:serine/threonine protein kinase
VKLGFDIETSTYVALKVFKLCHSFEQNKKTLQHEIDMMKRMNHPNLANLIEFIPDSVYVKKSRATYQTVSIVLEYAGGGELFEYVAQTGRFSE